MLELLLHLQLFNISTHHKKCKRANNHNKSILKSIPDVKECSLSLFAVFYWISDGGLERKSNSLTVSLFFCVTMCLLTAIFPCFHFIFPLIWLCLCFIWVLVGFPFVLKTVISPRYAWIFSSLYLFFKKEKVFNLPLIFWDFLIHLHLLAPRLLTVLRAQMTALAWIKTNLWWLNMETLSY